MPEFCSECNAILIHPSEGPYCSGCQSAGRPSSYQLKDWADKRDKQFRDEEARQQAHDAIGFYLTVTMMDKRSKESDVTFWIKKQERIFFDVIVNQLISDPNVYSVKIVTNRNRDDRQRYSWCAERDEEILFISKDTISKYKP